MLGGRVQLHHLVFEPTTGVIQGVCPSHSYASRKGDQVRFLLSRLQGALWALLGQRRGRSLMAPQVLSCHVQAEALWRPWPR